MKNYKSGQIALIVLLIMVILLTIGLSLISHSITDVSISQDEKEAMRAFSAAEAGIEEALRQQNLGTLWTSGSLDIDGTPVDIIAGPNPDAPIRSLAEGESMNIDIGDLLNNTTLTINWIDGAALEITIYEDSGSIRRRAYSSPSSACADNFTAETDDPPSVDELVFITDDLVRIKALCSGTTVEVSDASGNLPIQDYIVESRAAVGGAEGSKTSAIEVAKTVPALPPVFDYVLFSGGSL